MNAPFSFFLVGVLAFSTFGCSTVEPGGTLIRTDSAQELIWAGDVNGTQIVWTDDDIQITRSGSREKPFSLLSAVKEVERLEADRLARESPDTIGKRTIVRGNMRILSVVGDVLAVEVGWVAWVENAGASTAADVRILTLDLGASDLRQEAIDQLRDTGTASGPSIARFVPEKILFDNLLTTVHSANCYGLPKEPRHKSLDDLLKAGPCVGKTKGFNTFLDQGSVREFWLSQERDDILTFRIAVYTQETRVLEKRSIPISIQKKDVLLAAQQLEGSLLIDRQLLPLQSRYAEFDLKCDIVSGGQSSYCS